MTLTPNRPATPSLYELALDSQEIDGELAIALDKASSEDPEEQQEAEDLITALLQRANTNQRLLHQKANSICYVRELLQGKADFLRKSAAERLAKAEAEERAAERLLGYLTRCLSALNPGQTKFDLPEYTVSARNSEAVEANNELLPASCKRYEVKVKLAAGHAEAADQLIAVVQEAVRDLFSLGDDECSIVINAAPDKAAIKALLKAGETIPGAHLIKRTSWSIK
jgi:hypothetical protein